MCLFVVSPVSFYYGILEIQEGCTPDIRLNICTGKLPAYDKLLWCLTNINYVDTTLE